MPKPLNLQNQQAGFQLDLTPASHPSTGVAPAVRLRGPRSQAYRDMIAKLDAGTFATDRTAFEQLMAAIARELPELKPEQLPIGFVSRCHLGEPYEVHIVDLVGNIVQHYMRHEMMPSPFDRARELALHDAYCFIEIYTDNSMGCVRTDGTVTRI